jgi:hypothetical protein
MLQESLLSCSRLAQLYFSTEDDDKVDPHIQLTLLQKRHHRLLLHNRQPRQRLGPRIPKGVTEPFIFHFIFAWGMKYLHPLFEAGPHRVQHLGVHNVVFNYVVPDAYMDIRPDIAVYSVGYNSWHYTMWSYTM